MKTPNMFCLAAKTAKTIEGKDKFYIWKTQKLLVFPTPLSVSDFELTMIKELLACASSKQGTVHACCETNTLALVTSENSNLVTNFEKARTTRTIGHWLSHRISYKEGQEIVKFRVALVDGNIKILSAQKQIVTKHNPQARRN